MDRSASAEQSRRAGRELAQSFMSGASPRSVPVRFALGQGEFCVGEVPVAVYQELEGDGTYVKKSGGYIIGSSPGGMVLGAAFSASRLTANIVGNSMRKSRAAKQAAPQWRQIDSGRMYLTNLRFAIQGGQWNDLWFQNVRIADCDGFTIELHLSGGAPVRLEMPAPDYWYVMFNKLAYDRIEMPGGMPPPAAVAPPVATSQVRLRPPVEIVGRWISSQSDLKTLEITDGGTFVLTLPSGERQTGDCTAAGPVLTLKATGGFVATEFTWSAESSHLSLRKKDGSVSSYRRG